MLKTLRARRGTTSSKRAGNPSVREIGERQGEEGQQGERLAVQVTRTHERSPSSSTSSLLLLPRKGASSSTTSTRLLPSPKALESSSQRQIRSSPSTNSAAVTVSEQGEQAGRGSKRQEVIREVVTRKGKRGGKIRKEQRLPSNEIVKPLKPFTDRGGTDVPRIAAVYYLPDEIRNATGSNARTAYKEYIMATSVKRKISDFDTESMNTQTLSCVFEPPLTPGTILKRCRLDSRHPTEQLTSRPQHPTWLQEIIAREKKFEMNKQFDQVEADSADDQGNSSIHSYTHTDIGTHQNPHLTMDITENGMEDFDLSHSKYSHFSPVSPFFADLEPHEQSPDEGKEGGKIPDGDEDSFNSTACEEFVRELEQRRQEMELEDPVRRLKDDILEEKAQLDKVPSKSVDQEDVKEKGKRLCSLQKKPFHLKTTTKNFCNKS